MPSFGRHFRQQNSNCRTFLLWLAGLAACVALAVFVVSCGGGKLATQGGGSGTGSITVNLSDPPSCAFPNSAFEHVYVTIRSVQANMSAAADDNSPGWQELAPQLSPAPIQIDLSHWEGRAAC